jgi:uncharacterized protein YcbX
LNNTIGGIYRYPVKGLSGEKLQRVFLTAGCVVPGDREYALSRAGSYFNSDTPSYLPKTNFLALVSHEKMAIFDTRFDSTTKILTIIKDRNLLLKANLSEQIDCDKVAIFFQKQLGFLPDLCPYVVKASDDNNGHSFSDVPEKAISFLNLASIRELGKKIGKEISPMRFRGNILFENSNAWQEFNWVNRKLKIGEAVLYVFKRTQRCAATMVNPLTAFRDINIPKELLVNFGHVDMGIYAKVIEGGVINTGDEIRLI